MSSATFAGNPDASGGPGFCPAPPPPPPPPGIGQMPAMRINTAETPVSRRPMPRSNDPYEPPAAIQNAMMTKDKKPFTYTPGMGGKLDLSQIRSPRMARRVAKNANDEGIEGPPKSPLAAEQAPRPVSTGANLFIQPQVAVPVFPTNAPQITRPQVNRTPSNVSEKSPEPPVRPTIKIEPRTPSTPNTPDTPTSPTQVNLAKAPTPWMQKNNKQQEDLPEWARKTHTNGNGSTSSNSPPQSPPGQIRIVQQVRPVQSPPAERVIPLRVEDRPSVFTAKNDPSAAGHHQFMQTQPHHQSRWYTPQNQQNNQAPRPVSSPPISQPSSGGAFIVPIAVEGSSQRSPPVVNSYQQPGWNEQPVWNQPTPSQFRGNVQRAAPPSPQGEPGPIQSRSFRVLQKITDTDSDEVDPDQIRKLQLTEDDKVLMNKFKEQVDGETYLHQEEDPRYRGAAIPSRAFRYLQNMTDSGDVVVNAAPRPVNSAIKKQNRNSRTFEETQANLPPSEQQVPEPKKYTGSAIPSRSFRILQAMTGPESVAKQDCRQADISCDENNSMGKQQGVFKPRNPTPINWAPIPCSFNQTNSHYYHHLNDCNNSIEEQCDLPYQACHDNVDERNASIAYSTINDYRFPSSSPFSTSSSSASQLRNTDRHYNNCLEVPQSEKWSGNEHIDDTTKVTEASDVNEEEVQNDKVEENGNENVESDDDTESTSDSSESSLSEVENCPVDDDVETSSSESDSESYVAYTTGFNAQESPKDKTEKIEVVVKRQNSTDCESYSEEENEEEEEDSVAEKEKLEESDDENENKREKTKDDEMPNRKSQTEEKEVTTEVKNKTVEDDESAMTVSVRLPLRLKSNLSKNEVKESQTNQNCSIETSTSVDFTLRRRGTIRPKSWCPTKSTDEFWTSEVIEKKRNLSPVVFTVRSVDEDDEPTNLHDEKDDNDAKAVPQFEVVVAEDQKDEKQEESVAESNKNKYLLTVQNSRDETDDEDSGVTSDMSRLISEVDTDSESTKLPEKPSARKASAYKRTQTHSRLFRLLSGDSVLAEDDEDMTEDQSKHHLDIPLYDHSNNSSGLTSPDLSPIYEKSWRSFQESVSRRDGKDSYYKTWKEAKPEDQDGISTPGVISRISQPGLSLWPLKSNVLCPRVRSTKNVPRAIQGRICKPVLHPGPWGSKYDRC